MNTTIQTILDVTGMTCGSCVRRVTAALRGLDGVTAVEIQLRAGKVLVDHDPARAPVTALVAALERAGYGSRLGVAA
jgi:copper chaperone